MAEGNTPTSVISEGSSSEAAEAKLQRISEETIRMNPDMAGASIADDTALQRFLQQQRSDRMNELQSIQHNERPVTGQNHRQAIAGFMAKHTQEPAGAHNKANVPANVDAVEEHRPEAVVVEVQGVVEQQRVSTVLQSCQFRRHLENIIRGSITSARQSASAASSRARAPSSPRPATPVLSAAARGRTSSEETVASGSEGAASSVVEAAGIESSQQARNAPPAQEEPRLGVWEPVNVAPPARGEGGLWDTISRVQREEMVYEISDLLHRRLVSSTLGSEFRTVMEVHMQNRVANSETNGQQVADFVHNIRQSDVHVPNDFSHLGIAPAPRDDNSDNISITGISATAVPYTQTNLHLSREMQGLKSQMEEMKNMLRLSFDLQMDIQRAIRQEVAAAIASATAEGAIAGAAAPAAVRSTPVNDTHCLICLDNHTDSVLYQCGHMCVCFVCGKNLISRGNAKCPVCRAPIKDVIRAYKTNTE
ncbi:uncharacterized protein [Littorina saxatilis]|uniref:RING-type domain-containing protein n=1 Tax=Littorina saxatilis TaxID=31220 RepID=A0AAN9BPR7_9CAEN